MSQAESEVTNSEATSTDSIANTAHFLAGAGAAYLTNLAFHLSRNATRFEDLVALSIFGVRGADAIANAQHPDKLSADRKEAIKKFFKRVGVDLSVVNLPYALKNVVEELDLTHLETAFNVPVELGILAVGIPALYKSFSRLLSPTKQDLTQITAQIKTSRSNRKVAKKFGQSKDIYNRLPKK